MSALATTTAPEAAAVADARAAWQSRAETGAWLVIRHADVVRVLRDETSFGPVVHAETEPAAARACGEGIAPFVSRAAAAERLDALAVDALSPGIRARVVERLATFAGCGAVDFIELIGPLAAEVRATLAGVPAARQDGCIGWIEALCAPGSPTDGPRRQAKQALLGCARELLAARRERPGEDIVSDWIAAEDAEAPLADEDVASFLEAFVGVTGVASRNVAAAGLKLLFGAPWAAERLRREPRLLPGAVEEMLRLAPPFQMARRRARRDVTLGEAKIAAGEEVRLWLRAANRDAAVFDAPEAFDPGRPACSHLSFAAGGAFALTATLLRVELQILFEELLIRFPELLPAGPAELATAGGESRVLRLPVHLGTPS